ncbi:MAG: MATE family efflux transporter [Planctomycetota bacterium]
MQNLPGSRREVMRLAWPIGVSMLSFTMKGFVDMLMVGELGTDAFGAVGFASVATWFALTFSWGILRGQRPLVSQYLGSGDRLKAFSFGVHAFALAIVSGVLLLVFAAPMANLFHDFAATTEMEAEALDVGSSYFRIRLQWLLPTLMTFAIAEYLRSVGNMRVPMVVDLIAHPLNLLFNYALIFGKLGMPEMGADGAALGTGLADLCALLLIVYLVRQPKPIPRDAWRLKWARMKRVISVGITGGIQFTLENLSFLSITWIVGKTDTVALAVHQAGINLVHLSILPAVAIGDAGSVLIGKFVGERDWDGAKRTLNSTLQIMVPFMGCMAVVYLIFGRELSAIFLKNEEPEILERALDLGKGVMAACALWQLGDALQVAFRFALRAAGDHIWVMWTGILCTWLLSIPLCAWVVFVMDGDVAMVWFMWAAEIFVGGGIFLWRWRSGAWMKKRLVEDEYQTASADTVSS